MRTRELFSSIEAQQASFLNHKINKLSESETTQVLETVYISLRLQGVFGVRNTLNNEKERKT